MNDQLKEWMSKISSDSEMRSQMMDMMIEKTKGNKEELMKLVDSFITLSNNQKNYYSLQKINPFHLLETLLFEIVFGIFLIKDIKG